MLHMIVVNHGADTCAAVNPQSAELLRRARADMDSVCQKHGVGLQGWWVDAPGHTYYMLADAPNAHSVNNLMTELKLFHWNTIDIRPIVTMDEAMPLVAQ